VKALLIDDDTDLLDLMTYALRREGYTVHCAVDGQQALERVRAEDPDIILLDVTLPKLNGFDVCRMIRRDWETPIMMLTACNAEEDIVRGFEVGADDYVSKPFSAKQVAARMKALLRRSRADRYRQPVSLLRVGDLVLDLESHEVTRGGKQVELTTLEFRVLYMLAMNVGRIIPYARLVEYAWDYDGGDAALLKTHISHIRKKLGIPYAKKGGIEAIAKVGYRLRM
jgi:DNA-binding response OmpR family regulator